MKYIRKCCMMLDSIFSFLSSLSLSHSEYILCVFWIFSCCFVWYGSGLVWHGCMAVIGFDFILYLYYSLVRYSAYIKLLTDWKDDVVDDDNDDDDYHSITFNILYTIYIYWIFGCDVRVLCKRDAIEEFEMATVSHEELKFIETGDESRTREFTQKPMASDNKNVEKILST